MRVRIHRGAHEIGGNCIELEHAEDRLVLDLGRPLSASWNDEVPLPSIEGLSSPSSGLQGVVLSHPHLDHYGLASQLDPSVPVYLGAEAARLLEAAAFFSPVSRCPNLVGNLSDRNPLTIGPFTVTPYLVDHSAFDAYSLHVEAGGRNVFYTADFRAHGRKSRLFEALVGKPPHAEAILMEGTNVRKNTVSQEVLTESDVEDQMVKTFGDVSGLVAVFSSAQNIDRLVTAYRAARRAKRVLVVDLYTATVAGALDRSTIPQPGFEDFAVFVPSRQRRLVAQSQEFSRVAEIADIRCYPEDLATGRGKYAFYGVSSAAEELVDTGVLHGGAVVWSLWHGYLEQASGKRMQELLRSIDVPLLEHHTSGHATVEDLLRLVTAFEPARVVPIHSEATDRFADLFPRIEQHADGEWWEV